MGKTLHIFNPEHDLALAVGQGPYTPPREVSELKIKNALLPALFAGNSDLILVPHQFNPSIFLDSPFYPFVLKKNLTIVRPENLINFVDFITKISPWGWDHAVISELSSLGAPETMLPSRESIEKLRELSHRRTAILFRKELAGLSDSDPIYLPKELFNIKEVNDFISLYPKTFFKAPWSSSGRGIVVSDHIKYKGLVEWCSGVIRKQGSVIAEPAWDRTCDFASEWIIEDGRARFIGVSVFSCSSRGKYHGNLQKSQTELMSLIEKNVPAFSLEIIDKQRIVLDTLISPFYSGPLGIDMLADSSGRINPCVEINLRLTMGHIPILADKAVAQ